ncbi:MAG TPA: hypothetical protein VFN58_01315, partial [Candidatus Binatia bacterium]|nr:hypothetical protein [Candidatus Binatia bacterium]
VISGLFTDAPFWRRIEQPDGSPRSGLTGYQKNIFIRIYPKFASPNGAETIPLAKGECFTRTSPPLIVHKQTCSAFPRETARLQCENSKIPHAAFFIPMDFLWRLCN